MSKTEEQFDEVTQECRDLFLKKMKDYGTAWRILRPSSLTDQLYIKAQRIRSIEETGIAKVEEGVESEFIGIVNYSVMGCIQMSCGYTEKPNEEPHSEIIALYDDWVEQHKKLMIEKNHDYGEAWRKMRVSSMTDLILTKIFRTKQIEDNQGETLVSEGIVANYADIFNYAVFALIVLTQK